MPVGRLLRLLVLVILASACAAGRPEVARVGDRELGEAELEHAVALQRLLAGLQNAPCGQAAAGESETAACQRTALSGELLWLGIQDYAETNDLTVPAADVEEAVRQLEAQVGVEQLRAALGDRGLEREDLVELGRRILTLRAVRRAVAEDRVGDERLRALYEDRLVEFTTVRASHILVETQAEAELVYERVRAASLERFASVARRVSTEPGAAESGGNLGSAPASRYVPEFADAVTALEPGDVSPPVRTQFGWHVIYLVEKDVTPFEDAKAELLEPVADQVFQDWLERRAAELGVEVDPRYGRFRPRTFTVAAARSTDPEDDGTPTPSP